MWPFIGTSNIIYETDTTDAVETTRSTTAVHSQPITVTEPVFIPVTETQLVYSTNLEVVSAKISVVTAAAATHTTK